MQDEAPFRCIHAACARPLPRPVNFCPYCGTGQHAGVNKPLVLGPEVPFVMPPPPAPRGAPGAPSAGAASEPARDAPATLTSGVTSPESARGAPAAMAPGAPAPVPAPPPASAPPLRRAAAAAPPRPEPVRLRYWLLALGLLVAIWLTARPSTRKIDERIDRAIALSMDCNFGEAQAELISLRSSKATPEQLTRLQNAINTAVPACEKKRRGSKGAIEASRLKPRVDAAPASASAPRAVPGESHQAQSARNLIKEAERELAQGNYKAAADKMEICAAMVDAGNRECSAVKARAERLQRELQRCLAGGREWVGERCQ